MVQKPELQLQFAQRKEGEENKQKCVVNVDCIAEFKAAKGRIRSACICSTVEHGFQIRQSICFGPNEFPHTPTLPLSHLQHSSLPVFNWRHPTPVAGAADGEAGGLQLA